MAHCVLIDSQASGEGVIISMSHISYLLSRCGPGVVPFYVDHTF